MDEGRADEEDVEYLEKPKLANTSSFLTSFFSPAFLSPSLSHYLSYSSFFFFYFSSSLPLFRTSILVFPLRASFYEAFLSPTFLSFSYYHPYLTSIQDHQCRPLLDPQRNNGSLPLSCRSLPPGSFHTCSFLQWRRRTYSTSPWTLQPDKHMIRGQRSADQQCKKVECGPICQGFFLTLTPTKLN